jgi:hypothetical protein
MNKDLEQAAEEKAFIDLIQTSRHRGFRVIIANRIARIAILYAETEKEAEKIGEIFCKEYNNNYANQQKESEWVSVEKELPEEGHEVNIVINDSYVGTAIFSEGKFCNDYYDIFFSNNVTHWKPLPSAPKQ